MFNQDSKLVEFWAKRKKKGQEVPDFFNLKEEVDKYLAPVE